MSNNIGHEGTNLRHLIVTRNKRNHHVNKPMQFRPRAKPHFYVIKRGFSEVDIILFIRCILVKLGGERKFMFTEIESCLPSFGTMGTTEKFKFILGIYDCDSSRICIQGSHKMYLSR